MTEYGPQGTPVTIPAETPVVPAAPQAPVTVEPEVQPTSEGIEPENASLTPEEYAEHKSRVAAEQRQRAAQAQQALAAVKALLPAWEDRAAKALIKSDYQRGQRDNVLACLDDLRKALGNA